MRKSSALALCVHFRLFESVVFGIVHCFHRRDLFIQIGKSAFIPFFPYCIADFVTGPIFFCSDIVASMNLKHGKITIIKTLIEFFFYHACALVAFK